MLSIRILLSTIKEFFSLVFRPGKLSIWEVRRLIRAARDDARAMAAERGLVLLLLVDVGDRARRAAMVSYYRAAYTDYVERFHGPTAAFFSHESMSDLDDGHTRFLRPLPDSK